MRRNSKNYNYNRDLYNSRIKRSLYSLISVLIGLLFAYLAITNPRAKSDDKEKKQETKKEEKIDNFVKMEIE